MIYDTNQDIDERILRIVDKFAGMNVEQAKEYIAVVNVKEYAQWWKDYQEKTAKERKEDSKYLQGGDKNVIPTDTRVEIDDCIRITKDQVDNDGFVRLNDLGRSEQFVKLSSDKKCVYLSKELTKRTLSARKQRSVWD